MLVKAEVIKKADELNRMAAKLLPLPEGLTQAEQLLYKSLCIVYREFRAGQISSAFFPYQDCISYHHSAV